MSALSAVTERIGIGGTVSSTFSEPFPIARMLATMDHFSEGRIAWNVVTSTSDGEAKNFSRQESLLNHSKRYEKAREFIEVVKVLWDTWEDDALVVDKHSGAYANKDKIHYAHFHGDWFDIQGPLNVPRPPQGHPVTIQAGGSSQFLDLASRTADVIFAAEQSSIEVAKEFYSHFKTKVKENGRSYDDVKILPGLQPIIGLTEKEAKEKHEILKELHHPLATLSHLSSTMNYDWSQHALDDPFPNVLDKIERKDRFKNMLNRALEEKMTVRKFAKWVGASGFTVVGTPSSIADRMAKWYKENASDGFIIMPPYIPGAADDFFQMVIPELQQRGVFRTEYEGATLRDHLGLKRPTNLSHQGST